MISLIFAFIFFILFIFLTIVGGNYLLKSMIDNALSINSNETFSNLEETKNEMSINPMDEISINPMDECKKIDEITQNTLNFQTGTNIPLSPNYYKNYIGSIYMDDVKDVNELKNGKYCLKKSKLLYDGIWNSDIINESPYKDQLWELTDGDLNDGYYCSDKLVEVNKPFPKNLIDESAVSETTSTKYFTYFNDTSDDIYDKEIVCFPSVFNAGITEDLKKKFS